MGHGDRAKALPSRIPTREVSPSPGPPRIPNALCSIHSFEECGQGTRVCQGLRWKVLQEKGLRASRPHRASRLVREAMLLKSHELYLYCKCFRARAQGTQQPQTVAAENTEAETYKTNLSCQSKHRTSTGGEKLINKDAYEGKSQTYLGRKEVWGLGKAERDGPERAGGAGQGQSRQTWRPGHAGTLYFCQVQ